MLFTDLSIANRLWITEGNISIDECCGPIAKATEIIGKSDNLSEINYFAGQYERLTDDAKEKLRLVIDSGTADVATVSDLINTVANVNHGYDKVKGVNSPKLVALFHLCCLGFPNKMDQIPNLPEEYMPYIGSATMETENGHFFGDTYVFRVNVPFRCVYNGEFTSIPRKYRVAL